MTDLQFAILLGTIYIAPHIPKHNSLFLGCAFLLAAAVMGVLL